MKSPYIARYTVVTFILVYVISILLFSGTIRAQQQHQRQQQQDGQQQQPATLPTNSPITRIQQTTFIPINCSNPEHLVGEYFWDPQLPVKTKPYFAPTVDPFGKPGHLVKKYFKRGQFADGGVRIGADDPKSMRYHILLLMKSWARFATTHNIDYLVMYGSLLGLYFQDAPLSYDDDLDYTVTPEAMRKLATLNNTIVEDRYLLDINPLWCSRAAPKFTENIIEGHWVDMQTGLYIDLTSFSPIEYEYHPEGGAPYLYMEDYRKNASAFWKDTRGMRTYNPACHTQGEEIPQPQPPPSQRRRARNKPEPVYKLYYTGAACLRDKSQHVYLESDLFPAQIMLYGGVPVPVPNNMEQVLIDRYGERFRDLSHYSPRWDIWYDFDLTIKDWVVRQEYEDIKKSTGTALQIKQRKQAYIKEHKALPLRPVFPTLKKPPQNYNESVYQPFLDSTEDGL